MPLKEKVDYLLKAGYLLTLESDEPERGWAVAVKGALIHDLGPYPEMALKYDPAMETGGEHKLLMPGFVNTHTHAPMVYLRGIADDLPLKDWLEKHIWPLEAKWLGPEFVEDATRLACLEMMRAGITTFCDMYFYGESAARSVKELGMRAVIAAGIVDFPTRVARTCEEYLARAEDFIRNFLKDELTRPAIAPHSVYTCGPESLKKAVGLAEKYNIIIPIHVSETRWELEESNRLYGQTTIKFLEKLGVLSKRIVAAHCVWVDDDEIDILARREVGVSHCIESNLKLASGIAPVPKMLARGVKVTFGTDGAASNNDLNIMGEIATSAKVHKALSEDPTVLPSRTAIKMATLWGAEALGLGGKTGSIKKGKAADLIMLDLDKPRLTPMYNAWSHLVYAALPSDVESVMVNGKLLMHERKVLAADEQAILARAREWAARISG